MNGVAPTIQTHHETGDCKAGAKQGGHAHAGHALKSANSNPAVDPVCKGCHGSSSDSSALVSRGAMGPWWNDWE